MWQSINWEHILYAVFTIITACGVSFAWLQKLCRRIETTNTDVEAHKQEIREIVAEMRKLVEEGKK